MQSYLKKTPPETTEPTSLRRSWYDVKSNYFFTTQSHSVQVSQHPGIFRLSPEDLGEKYLRGKDYDCALLFLAMRKSFVRFLMNFSGRPQENNIEGARISDLRLATRALLTIIPTTAELMLVHRIGPSAKDAFLYKLSNQEDLVSFVEDRKLPPPLFTPETLTDRKILDGETS